MPRKRQMYCSPWWCNIYILYMKWKEFEWSLKHHCFLFHWVQWGKYTLFLKNTASEMSIAVIRRYLRIGRGKTWWDLNYISSRKELAALRRCTHVGVAGHAPEGLGSGHANLHGVLVPVQTLVYQGHWAGHVTGVADSSQSQENL